MTTALDRTVVSRMSEAQFRLTEQGQWVATLIDSTVAPDCASSIRIILMPPGHHSGAHLHQGHEVMVRVDMGFAASLIGDNLTPVVHRVGDPIRIHSGDLHAAVNLSATRWCAAIEVFSDPDDEDVQLRPDKDEQVHQIARELQTVYADDAVIFASENMAMIYQRQIERLGVQIPSNAAGAAR